MSTISKDYILTEDYQLLKKLIGILQKRGNKQRALSLFSGLIKILKEGIAGFPINKKYPLKTLIKVSPLNLIHKSLYNLKPAFLLRPIIRSGRRYDLPVPITDKRATFMALNWVRKVALKNNKNDLSFSYLLASEISALLHRRGSAQEFLKAHINIALDQRPFERFIKKKRYAVSKSKETTAAAHFKKLRGFIRRSIKNRKYHTIRFMKKIHMPYTRKNFIKKREHEKLKIIRRLREKSKFNKRKKRKIFK